MIYEEVIKRIEEIAPPQLAPDWDNSGIQIYTGKKEIEKDSSLLGSYGGCPSGSQDRRCGSHCFPSSIDLPTDKEN